MTRSISESVLGEEELCSLAQWGSDTYRPHLSSSVPHFSDCKSIAVNGTRPDAYPSYLQHILTKFLQNSWHAIMTPINLQIEKQLNLKYALENLFRVETTAKQMVKLTYPNSP